MVAAVLGGLLAGGAWAAENKNTVISGTDVTYINVLREYSGTDGKNVIGLGTWNGRNGANDGGAWNDEVQCGDSATGLEEYTHTWMLPDVRTIGSWCVQMQTAPATLKLEYLTAPLEEGGKWVQWNTNNDAFAPGATYSGKTDSGTSQNWFTETPVNAYGIRYVASGLTRDTANGYLRLNELQVFLAEGQTVSYTDGFNVLTLPGLVKAQYTSGMKSGVWASPTSGNAGLLCDGILYAGGELHAKPEGGREGRAYIGYALDGSTPMTSFTIGGSSEQGWDGYWEVYTCNGEFINPADLDNTIEALTQAGWTLQYSYTTLDPAHRAGGRSSDPCDFLFENPGYWDNILVVWDLQGGAIRELEIHAAAALIPPVPEPATMTLLALGGLALLRRRRV